MNLTCPDKELNFLSPNGFTFTIAKLPELTYYCQQISVPSMEVPPAELETPFSSVAIRGERLVFNQLDLTFLVDSEMSNYRSMHAWMTSGLLNTDILDRHDVFSDATLSILSPSNQVVASLRFTDLVPVGLGELQFSNQNSDVQFISCTASFRYSAFEFI